MKNNVGKKRILYEASERKIKINEQIISDNVEEITAILSSESQTVTQNIESSQKIIEALKSQPFSDFKLTIETKTANYKTSLTQNSDSFKDLLITLMTKYSEQITELYNSKVIDEEQKNNFENIINEIKKYSDSITNKDVVIDEEFFKIIDYIDEYNGNLNFIISKSLINVEFYKFFQENIGDVQNLLASEFDLLQSIRNFNDYNDINEIILDGVKKNTDEGAIIENIQNQLLENISKESQKFDTIIQHAKDDLSLLVEKKVTNQAEINDVTQLITALESKKERIKAITEQMKTNNREKFILSKSYKPITNEEIPHKEQIERLDNHNKELIREMTKISKSIEEYTKKYSIPVTDIEEELKKIRLESTILGTKIKEKDTSFFGQFSSDGFLKGLVKSNVNMYLHTNKNKLINMFFDNLTDENDAKAYKEKITKIKKSQIMLIEEEVLYMSKISKGRTSKEITEILNANNITVTNNPLDFKSPIFKFASNLYSTFYGFLNDPTTMIYACYSSFTWQNIFTKSFMTTFFGGLTAGGLGVLVQDSVLKDTFYMKFEFKNDNWMKYIFYELLGLGEISDFIIDKMFGSEISFRSLLTSIITLR